MVAVASPARVRVADSRGLGWTLGAVAVLLVGLGLRVLIGGAGVGDRSAIVMTVLLGVGAWAAARLLSGPRAAFIVTVVLVALLDLAALPQRTPPPFDDLQAFYSADQVLVIPVSVPPGLDPAAAALTILVQPTFAASQPQFGLAGTVNGAPATWSCAFQHGIQTIALPVPPGALASGATADAELHLTGSPSRESEYLVVYASSQRGGFVASLAPLASLDAGVTRCTLA